MTFTPQRLQDYIDRYPKLPALLLSGNVSFKVSKTILDLDKWQWDELYPKLLEDQIVQGKSSNMYCGTEQAVAYIKQKGY